MKIEDAMALLDPDDRQDLRESLDGLTALRKKLGEMRAAHTRCSSEHTRLCAERNRCQAKWGEPGVSEVDRDATHSAFSKLTAEINGLRKTMTDTVAGMADLEAESAFDREVRRLVKKAAEIKGAR